MCFRNSERISGHKTVMNAEWVCRAEVSITRWKIINTSFGEFHNIWAAANSKQLKSSLDLILRGKHRENCCLFAEIDLWWPYGFLKREEEDYSLSNQSNFHGKTNDISQTLKSKQTHVTPLGEGKVLKKTPTYVSLKLKIFWGECAYICWNIDSP